MSDMAPIHTERANSYTQWEPRTIERCPCCDQPLPDVGLRWNKIARALVWPNGVAVFTRRETALFDVMWRRPGHLMTCEALLEAICIDDPDGGPENFANIGQHIMHMRAKMRGAPVGLKSRKGRDGGYWLTTVSRDAQFS